MGSVKRKPGKNTRHPTAGGLKEGDRFSKTLRDSHGEGPPVTLLRLKGKGHKPIKKGRRRWSGREIWGIST